MVQPIGKQWDIVHFAHLQFTQFPHKLLILKIILQVRKKEG